GWNRRCSRSLLRGLPRARSDPHGLRNLATELHLSPEALGQRFVGAHPGSVAVLPQPASDLAPTGCAELAGRELRVCELVDRLGVRGVVVVEIQFGRPDEMGAAM